MKEIIEAGKLRIYDSDFYSDELVDAIRFVSRKLRVKAVFIDYVQLLYKQGGSKLQRNEELKAIAKSLRELAKEAKLPIVLSAQLNREAKSPTEMFSQNIADSADLRKASVWSSELLERYTLYSAKTEAELRSWTLLSSSTEILDRYFQTELQLLRTYQRTRKKRTESFRFNW